MKSKTLQREKIKFRVRKKISGTPNKPRVSIFRSNTEVYLQAIDDVNNATVAAASTKDKSIVAAGGTKSDKAKAAGLALASKVKALGIETVVFDRNGYLYHGRIKSAAEGAREGGLQF
jgi:large subunit ribosomal protein L18